MVDGNQLAGALVQLATGGAAVGGVLRCVRLQRFGGDPRLKALAWFFALFAAAMVFQAAWQVQLEPRGPGNGHGFPGPSNGTRDVTGPDSFHRGPFQAEGEERVNILLVVQHVFMLGSLAVAVWAFGRRRAIEAAPVAALTPFLLVGTLVPLMLALEAGLALYLAARAFVNHVERRSAGAVQVALGFLLFFVGHLLFFVAHTPGVGRTGVGDVLGLVGIVLLVQVLPGKS